MAVPHDRINKITDLSQCSIMAEESGTGGPVTHPQDVSLT
jgi:hypothetical protein